MVKIHSKKFEPVFLIFLCCEWIVTVSSEFVISRENKTDKTKWRKFPCCLYFNYWRVVGSTLRDPWS